MNNKGNNYLVSLGENKSMEIAVVGGKGASLGKLVKAKFPVPYNLKIAKLIEEIIKEVAPDRKMHLAMSYAKGNQVVVEGIISWTEKGIFKESPFISFLLLDKDGLIIRDRRHITLQNWPAAEKMKKQLGLQ